MSDAAHKGLQPGYVLHALQHRQDGQRFSRFDLNSLHQRIRLVGRLLLSRWRSARPGSDRRLAVALLRIGPMATPDIFTAVLLALTVAILLLRKV